MIKTITIACGKCKNEEFNIIIKERKRKNLKWKEKKYYCTKCNYEMILGYDSCNNNYILNEKQSIDKPK